MIDTIALREKVLDLAIRGKLVPQDPSDEPASVLLERIRAQKQQMVKEGKLKAKDIKDDSIIYVGEDNLHYEKFADGTVKCIEDEIPFELPIGWAWCRLSMIGTTNIGLTYKPTDVAEEGTMVLRSCNIKNGKIDLADLIRVKTDIRDNQYIENNDILICARNGSKALVGKCAVIQGFSEKASFGAFMAIYRSSCYKYVYHFLNTSFFRLTFDNDDSKQINQLTQAMLKNAFIPLPPFAEQQRIVDKLGELFELVENIEDGVNDIEQLVSLAKSKILDLAIRGKLVPQNPEDEPASVLLERIRAEKEELIRQGKIKRDKKESVIFKGEDNSYYEKIGSNTRLIEDLPFTIPDNWAWCNITDISDIIMGSSPEGTSILPFGEGMEFHQGKIHFTDKVISASDKSTISPTKIAPDNSVLLCVRAPVGEINITDRELCIGRGLASVHPIAFMECEFLFYWMLNYKEYLNLQATGSTFVAITADTVKSIKIPLPPLSEQHRIVSAINDLLNKIILIEKSLA